jgi:hypothetical protein
MKKVITLLIISVVLNLATKAQISDAEFKKSYNSILENLSNEKWKTVNSISILLLNKIGSIDSMAHEKSVLRYIIIYANAGLLNNKEITKDEALKRAIIFKGKELSMPAHPFRKDCYVNCTHLAEDRQNTLFSAVNNSLGTQIFAFEYVKLKKDLDQATINKIEGKNVALSGVLKDVSVQGYGLPRYKLEFEDGDIEILEE